MRAHAFRTHGYSYEDVEFQPREWHPAHPDVIAAMGHLWNSGVLRRILPEEMVDHLQDAVKDCAWPTVMQFAADMLNRAYIGSFPFYGERGGEPEWVNMLPDAVQRMIRFEEMIRGNREQFHIVGYFALTDSAYVFFEGGVLEDAWRTFNLGRLQQIRQLANLQAPRMINGVIEPDYWGFGHTRYEHVLDVSQAMLLLCQRNRVPRSLTNVARVASFLHDTLTPAHGDGTKRVDETAFDEDAMFGTLFSATDCRRFCERRGFSPETLTSIVQGVGVFGELHDIADKLSYVARDANEYLSRYRPYGPLSEDSYYHRVRDILVRRPDIFLLWDTVRIMAVDGEQRPVFQDPEWLFDFLLLRMLMFRGLYQHEASQFFERLMARVLQYLYDAGRVTADQLLIWGDKRLEAELCRFLFGEGCSWFRTADPKDFHDARVLCFATIEEAKVAERELLTSGREIAFVEEFRPIKPATRFLVQKSKTAIASFEDAYPGRAAFLTSLGRFDWLYRVYSCASSDCNPNLLLALEHHRGGRKTFLST